MTREEQLDWLCRLRSEIYVYMPKNWLIPMDKALEMAISALKQEPTQFEEIRREITRAKIKLYSNLDEFNQGTVYGFNKALDIIDKYTK